MANAGNQPPHAGTAGTVTGAPIGARGFNPAAQGYQRQFDQGAVNTPVSYTHLTLPTICSV